MTSTSKTEETTASHCLEEVPGWDWYLEVGYNNGQIVRVPAPDEEQTKGLLQSFREAAPTNSWVNIDGTASISAAALRYLQVGHRALPCRVEPIGFATEPAPAAAGAEAKKP